MSEVDGPYIEIVAQPPSRIRFRYLNEAGSPMINADKKKITVRIHNTSLPAKLVVSCVGCNSPYYPHPNILSGEDCKDDMAIKRLNPDSTFNLNLLEHKFEKLCIMCVKSRKKINEECELTSSINRRRANSVDPFSTGFDGSASLDLSVVRLAFQAYLPGTDNKFNVPLTPVVSEPIYDSKKVKDLEIIDIIPTAVTFNGGKIWIMAQNNLTKEQTKVIFYVTHGNQVIWERSVVPSKIHKVVAIVNAPEISDADRSQFPANKCNRLSVNIVVEKSISNGADTEAFYRCQPRDITYTENGCYMCGTNNHVAPKRKRANKSLFVPPLVAGQWSQTFEMDQTSAPTQEQVLEASSQPPLPSAVDHLDDVVGAAFATRQLESASEMLDELDALELPDLLALNAIDNNLLKITFPDSDQMLE